MEYSNFRILPYANSLSHATREWVKKYRQFISIQNDDEDEIADALEDKKWPLIPGPKNFVDRMKGECYALRGGEIPDAGTFVPNTEERKKWGQARKKWGQAKKTKIANLVRLGISESETPVTSMLSTIAPNSSGSK